MANVTTLRIGLHDYHQTLSRQLAQVSREFQEVENRLYALGVVYEGVAADEFKRHWQMTVTNFNEYIEQGQKIAAVLEERIEALDGVDNVAGL